MRVPVEMPRLGEEDQARLTTWLKEIGETVSRGEPIAEVETDKATIDVESLHAGELVEIVHAAGSEVQVGEVIAYLETGD